MNSSLLARMGEALEGTFRYRSIAEKSAIIAIASNGHATHTLLIQVNESTSTIQLILRFERKLADQKQEEMAVFMGQANCSVFDVGGAEMDPLTGECQFRHAVDVSGFAVNRTFLLQLVTNHIKQGDRCWQGVEAVMNGADHRAALALIS
jgi:hypothetical protein